MENDERRAALKMVRADLDQRIEKGEKLPPHPDYELFLCIRPCDHKICAGSSADMAEIEKRLRKIERDGLIWRRGYLIPLANGKQMLDLFCAIDYNTDAFVEDLLDAIVQNLDKHVQTIEFELVRWS